MSSPKQLATAGVTAPAGTIIVPEAVKAVNIAIQHAFRTRPTSTRCRPSYPPIGKIIRDQVTSPIIGSVNLDGARDITGAALVPDSATILDKAGVKIPLRSNLLVTAGFSLPGFDGLLRGFRVYKPVADGSKASGYKFVSDGTLLWKACVPGTSLRGRAGCVETQPLHDAVERHDGRVSHRQRRGAGAVDEPDGRRCDQP